MKRYNLTALPKYHNRDHAIYGERESGNTHLSFSIELAFCNAIRSGDIAALEDLLVSTLNKEIIIGSLGRTALTQMRYWAITVIATSIHYAILGGLDETDAYNLSDECIRDIDAITDLDKCIEYLIKRARELVVLVSNTHTKPNVSAKIKKVQHYIHIHLHDKISISELAALCDLSEDYLGSLFKKETGKTIHNYIIEHKLDEARKLLSLGMTSKEISYTLAFSSQSHFIATFKKFYGVTPFDMFK